VVDAGDCVWEAETGINEEEVVEVVVEVVEVVMEEEAEAEAKEVEVEAEVEVGEEEECDTGGEYLPEEDTVEEEDAVDGEKCTLRTCTRSPGRALPFSVCWRVVGLVAAASLVGAPPPPATDAGEAGEKDTDVRALFAFVAFQAND
jgi:hypothetical protein